MEVVHHSGIFGSEEEEPAQTVSEAQHVSGRPLSPSEVRSPAAVLHDKNLIRPPPPQEALFIRVATNDLLALQSLMAGHDGQAPDVNTLAFVVILFL